MKTFRNWRCSPAMRAVSALLLCLGLNVGHAVVPPAGPGVSISDGEDLLEGDSGTASSDFTLTRDGDLSSGVVVTIRTAEGGLNPATADQDFVAIPPGTRVLIPAGQPTANVAVQVIGDTEVEPDESFMVHIESAKRLDPLVTIEPRSFLTAAEAVHAAVADLDGDNLLDLLVANTGEGGSPGSVSVLFGSGDGNFAPAINYVAGAQPRAVAIADLNADLAPDLLIADSNSAGVTGTVWIMLNNGDGSFATAVGYPAAGLPWAISVADFNADGWPDFAVVNANGDSFWVRFNTGSGSFGDAVVYGGFHLPLAIAAQDINGDMRADLVVLGLVTGCGSPFCPPSLPVQAAVLINNGDGSFAAPVFYPAGTRAGYSSDQLFVGDLNGDTIPDLAALGTELTILINAGDGSFAPARVLAVGPDPIGIEVEDFDRDGRPDIAVTNQSATTLSLLRNIGGGDFSPAVNWPAPFNSRSISSGDFNGDQRPDLVIPYYRDLVRVVLNPSFASAGEIITAAGSAPRAVAVADLDADGIPDMAVANNASNDVSVLIGLGDGGFAPPVNYATGGTGPSSVAVGDFNRDGRPDLAVGNKDSDKVSVLINAGAGTFFKLLDQECWAVVSLDIGDLNGDGNADIACVDNLSGAIMFWLGRGDGNFDFAGFARVSAAPSALALGDLNADGKLDMVVTNHDNASISVLLRDDIGGLENALFANHVQYPVANAPSGVALGDFNSDGRLDVAVSAEDGNVSVLMGNGAGGFGSRIDYPLAGSASAIRAGDLNGDGRLDLAVTRDDTPARSAVAVLIGDGTGNFSPAQDFPIQLGALGLALADLNLDGELDMATVSPSAGNVAVLLAAPAIPVRIDTNEGMATILNDDFPPPPDLTPDSFGFLAQSDVSPATWVYSNTYVITGIDSCAPLAVAGGGGGSDHEFRVSGGAGWTSAGGLCVNDGEVVQLRHQSSSADTDSTTTTLCIGPTASEVCADFVSTTADAVDDMPDPINFVPQFDVPANTRRKSNPVTPTGFSVPVAVSVSDGSELRIGGAAWRRSGTLNPGEAIRVRHTSALGGATLTRTTLMVGAAEAVFETTTAAGGDSVPDAFGFPDLNGAAVSSWALSKYLRPTGFSEPLAVSISAGSEFRIGGRDWATAGTLLPGEPIRVRHHAAATADTAVVTVLTLGGVSGSFTSTTAP